MDSNCFGKFSVKSAYYLAREGSMNGGESSDPSGMKRFQKKIWKAQVPNKVMESVSKYYSNEDEPFSQ